MGKRLTAAALALLMIFSTALAGTHDLDLTPLNVEEMTPGAYLSTEESRTLLIDAALEALLRNRDFTTSYRGFVIENARDTACCGIDNNGDVFIALINEKTGVMLSIVFDHETWLGTFTIQGGSEEAYQNYRTIAMMGETPAEEIDRLLAELNAPAVVEHKMIPDVIPLAEFQTNYNSVWAYAAELGAISWYTTVEHPERYDLYFREMLWVGSILADGEDVDEIAIVHEFRRTGTAMETGLSNFRLMLRNAIAALLVSGGMPVVEAVALAQNEAGRLLADAMAGKTMNVLFDKPCMMTFGPRAGEPYVINMTFRFDVKPTPAVE